jgi:hypothetical protein
MIVLFFFAVLGCGSTSVVRSVEGVGTVGDSLVLKRTEQTIHVSPWTGTSIEAREDYLVCKLQEVRVACSPATIELPASPQ